MSSSRRVEGNLLLIVEAADILEGKRTSSNEHGKKKPDNVLLKHAGIGLQIYD